MSASRKGVSVNLTFKGFLRLYCRELTGLNTDDLRCLSRTVALDAPAAAEAVMAFAAVQGKARYLAKLSKGTWMEEEYSRILPHLDDPIGIVAFLQSEQAPERYRKVWNAYLAKRDAVVADRRVSGLMREKTLAAMKARNVTPYRLCEDLGLNKGNVYAYLNKGDLTKVSRATARKIMEYACAA